MSFFAYRKLLPNLINSSWLWWIIRRVLANQRRRNIFEWILMIIVIIIISIIITLQWVNIKKWERGSDGHFHTNHWSLSTRASSWCLCLQEGGKGLLRRPRRRFSCEMYLHNYIYHQHLLFRLLLFDIFQTKSLLIEGNLLLKFMYYFYWNEILWGRFWSCSKHLQHTSRSNAVQQMI